MVILIITLLFPTPSILYADTIDNLADDVFNTSTATIASVGQGLGIISTNLQNGIGAFRHSISSALDDVAGSISTRMIQTVSSHTDQTASLFSSIKSFFTTQQSDDVTSESQPEGKATTSKPISRPVPIQILAPLQRIFTGDQTSPTNTKFSGLQNVSGVSIAVLDSRLKALEENLSYKIASIPRGGGGGIAIPTPITTINNLTSIVSSNGSFESLAVTSGSSTFANGINLTAGCVAINDTCITVGSGGSGITSLQAQYSSALTGVSQTLATTSDTNITLTITSSGSTHLFTPGWTGSLAASRGGTGITSVTANQLLVGNPGGTGWTQIATSSLGLTTTNVTEGNNLYWTNARFDARLAASTTIPTLTTLANLTTVGALTSGSIGSGFGIINIGSNALTAGAATLSSFSVSGLGTLSQASSTLFHHMDQSISAQPPLQHFKAQRLVPLRSKAF
jgi:hypothetical protein